MYRRRNAPSFKSRSANSASMDSECKSLFDDIDLPSARFDQPSPTQRQLDCSLVNIVPLLHEGMDEDDLPPRIDEVEQESRLSVVSMAEQLPDPLRIGKLFSD